MMNSSYKFTIQIFINYEMLILLLHETFKHRKSKFLKIIELDTSSNMPTNDIDVRLRIKNVFVLYNYVQPNAAIPTVIVI